MKETISSILAEVGDRSAIKDIQPVSGGDISEAFKITTAEGFYFVKYNPDVAEDFFQKEAAGLQLLKQAGTLRVPDVYGYSAAGSAIQGYIVMEWIEGQARRDTDEQLGRGLALLHSSHNDKYGLAEDNYIGTLPQLNGWYDDWVEFISVRRLAHLAKLTETRGYLPKPRREKLERLLRSLDQWIPRFGQPVLLHGDFWSGNWIAGPDGEPWIIDPAVFYGEQEFELAFTELFGGFSSRFYDAYEEVHPLSPDYQDRKQLYQLYYLLVHLALFGESYGPSVDRVLSHYVG